MDSGQTNSAPARSHVFGVLILVAASIPFYGAFLSLDVGPLGRDFGKIYLAMLQQQLDALRDGHLLLWDPILYGGTPFWSLPNTAPAYPPLVLPMLLFGALGGLNLSILAHVLFGALGVYALVDRLAKDRVAAVLGGVVYLCAHETLQMAYILPFEVMAMAWVPWTVLLLLSALNGPRWLACTLGAALAYAAVAWVGGYIVMLRGLLVVGTVVIVAAALGPDKATRIARGIGLLVLFFVVFMALSAGKLLPVWMWVPLTNRAEYLNEAFVLGGSLSPSQILAQTIREGWVPAVLAVIGLGACFTKRGRVVLPFAVAVVLILLLSEGTLHKLLWKYVPGFDKVREPRRAWVQMPAMLAVTAGLSLAVLLGRLRQGGAARLAAGVLVLGLLLFDVIVTPTYPFPKLTSLSERIEKNAIHRELAARAESESRFRVHDYADTRMHLKRTADVLRSALRLESLEALLGTISIVAYDRDFVMPSRDAPAKLWGLLNCRYVTSDERLTDPGLTLLAEFPTDPERLHDGTDGPYLYRNELELPRAFLVDHGILEVGGMPAQWQTLLLATPWDTRTTALIRASPDDLAAMDDDFFRRFDAVFLHEKPSAHADLTARLDALGGRVIRGARQTPASLADLASVLRSAKAPLQPVGDPPRAWNRIEVALPPDAGGRWLILAETCSIYPGWTVSVDGRKVHHFIANAAATAVPLPEAAERVRLEFTPPGFAAGMTSSVVAAILVLLVLAGALVRSVRERSATPASPEPASPEPDASSVLDSPAGAGPDPR